MMSDIEKLLDEDNCDPITLYDEDNKATRFDQVAIIPLDEKVYVILKPIDPIEGVEDDEAFVFVIEELDDEDSLVLVDDEELVSRIFDEYYKLFEEEND